MAGSVRRTRPKPRSIRPSLRAVICSLDIISRISICRLGQRARILVIGGLRDPSTPPSHSEALVAAIPNAKMEMLEAAHLANIEQPARFAAAILAHLEGRG